MVSSGAFAAILCALACWGTGNAQADAPQKPRNIVLLYADDLGYGDLGCYGCTDIPTRNVDRLCRDGLRFLDAHAEAATCTPSRYSILTGKYAFRKKGTDILPGDANLIIPPTEPNLAAVLKNAGYTTGIVGKWHLGLGYGKLDWNTLIAPGPVEIGFDYAFVLPATLDRVPCVYLEEGRVLNLDQKDPIQLNYQHRVGNDPTGFSNPELVRLKGDAQHSGTIIDGVPRIGFMAGGHSARCVDETMADIPGESNALVSQMDLPASLASLTKQTLSNTGELDSLNLAPALLGESATGRESLVEQGSTALGLRVGDWKLIKRIPKAAGREAKAVGVPPVSLYNLDDDPREKENLLQRNPTKAGEMEKTLEQIVGKQYFPTGEEQKD